MTQKRRKENYFLHLIKFIFSPHQNQNASENSSVKDVNVNICFLKNSFRNYLFCSGFPEMMSAGYCKVIAKRKNI